MSADGQIHWEEGLFLQPHHLQWMQKHILDKFARERHLFQGFPYGVLSMQISDDELSDFRVRFERLHAVMPGGLEIRVPEDTDLPALDVRQRFAAGGGALTIGLGVPLWYESRRNLVEGQVDEYWRVRQLYRVVDVQRADENTGENPQPIRVRRINARLLITGDDTSDLEVLPLLRLVPSVGEGAGVPRRDPAYVPACLLVSGAPMLTGLLRDLASQVMAARTELINRMTRAGSGGQIEPVLRLRTLSHFGPVLDSFRRVPEAMTPFDFYLLLRQLHGELAALKPETSLWEAPDYDHENAGPVLADVVEKIGRLLMETPELPYMKVPLERRDDLRCMYAVLTDEHLARASEFFLGIRTNMDRRQLAQLAEERSQFKLMPASLIDKPVFGVKLEYDAYTTVLPTPPGLHYFRLNRGESARMWGQIETEKTVAVRWTGMEAGGFDEMALYLIKPELRHKP